MNKTTSIIIAVVLAVGGGAFYGGMKYAGNNNSQARLSQLRSQQSGTPGAGLRGGRSGNQTGGGFASGEIISKDDKSITVKLRDARLPDGQGGSKIIFFSSSTEITKSAAGSAGDLTVGKNIFVNGDSNQDGSISAKIIQLSPQAK